MHTGSGDGLDGSGHVLLPECRGPPRHLILANPIQRSAEWTRRSAGAIARKQDFFQIRAALNREAEDNCRVARVCICGAV